MKLLPSRRVFYLQRRGRFHVTVPIFYVNSDPHIGHFYSMLLADVASRWQLLRRGKPSSIHFTAGTDEHGKKVQDAALAKGLTAQQHCDLYSAKFHRLFEHFNIRNTAFVRTTSKSHVEGVKHFWRELQAGGHIYKAKYEGWYSTVDECFYSDSQVENGTLRDGTRGKVSIETQSPVSRVAEENYAFDLTRFYDPIREWIARPDVVQPDHMLAQVHAFMADPA